jgi:3-hydroxyisobutyrate dehydrogenase-like beta-hydroxyacid dehydrogenase
MALALAFLGYGEVGQLFARQLTAKGARVAVHDVKPLVAIAAQDGVRFASGLADAVEGADIVISAVTADSAEPVARAAAPYLRSVGVYVDLNSVSPNTKRAVAQALGGVDFVEFAVMSPVAGLGIAAPILAGG